jgi:hypothetical protein
MAKSLKIPKKVAGVKLPKKVRKRAKKAIKAGASPVVREIAAAALGAAAAKAGSSGRARAHIHIDGGKIGETIRAAAIDGLQRFLEGMEEGLRAMKDRDEGGAKAPSRSKAKRGSRARGAA